jgi:hypothetical protein
VTNPWLKKNPFMSMWLSSFNTAANSMRGYASSQLKRQTAATTAQVTKSFVDAWLGVPSKPKTRRRKKKR